MRCSVIIIGAILCSVALGEASAQTDSVRVRVQGARLRAGPSFESVVIRTLGAGQFVVVVDRDGDWVRVRLNQQVGYVHHTMLPPLAPGAARQPTPASRETDTPSSPQPDAPSPAESTPAALRDQNAALATGFAKGRSFIGPALSLSGVGTAPVIEGHFEHAQSRSLGIGAFVALWSYGEQAFRGLPVCRSRGDRDLPHSRQE
jgi:hypothetical protein